MRATRFSSDAGPRFPSQTPLLVRDSHLGPLCSRRLGIARLRMFGPRLTEPWHARTARGRPLARPAFSLLEMVLATAVIVLIMGTVIEFYNFALESRRLGGLRVQQAQTARMLLEQIAHDIRGTAPN